MYNPDFAIIGKTISGLTKILTKDFQLLDKIKQIMTGHSPRWDFDALSLWNFDKTTHSAVTGCILLPLVVSVYWSSG